jgi:hypothetical protein
MPVILAPIAKRLAARGLWAGIRAWRNRNKRTITEEATTVSESRTSTSENRSMFDWLMFLAIHAIIIGGISYAGWNVYGERLGIWVAASATVAGITSAYLYAKIVPGETFMKIILGLIVAANAGYIVHNGARNMGIESFNLAQVQKFEIAMAAASRARTRAVANAIGLGARESTQLERAFADSTATIAAILAFLELCAAVTFFAIASKRVNEIENQGRQVAAVPLGFASSTTNYTTPAFTGNSRPKA